MCNATFRGEAIIHLYNRITYRCLIDKLSGPTTKFDDFHVFSFTCAKWHWFMLNCMILVQREVPHRFWLPCECQNMRQKWSIKSSISFNRVDFEVSLLQGTTDLSIWCVCDERSDSIRSRFSHGVRIPKNTTKLAILYVFVK